MIETSQRHHENLAKLGATTSIDYTTGPAHLASVKDMDMVVDSVAWKYMESTLDPASGVLKPAGVYCHIMSSDWQPNAYESGVGMISDGPFQKWASRFRSILDPSTRRVFTSGVIPDAGALSRIASFVDAGKIQPVIARTVVGLDLEEVRSAFALLEDGHAGGKIIVRPTAEEWW